MAGVNLYLSTAQIWDHFFDNVARLQDNEDCIAENSDNGMSLYLTANTIFPELVLYNKNTPTLYRLVRNRDECGKWAVYLITKYVAAVPVDGVPEEKPKIIELPTAKVNEPEPADAYDGPSEDEEEQKIMDLIYQREDELSMAMGDLLAVVLCEDDRNAILEAYGTSFIDGVVDDFLDYLYENHMVSIYRPTLEYDEETGCEVLKEFPYGWGEDYEVE